MSTTPTSRRFSILAGRGLVLGLALCGPGVAQSPPGSPLETPPPQDPATSGQDDGSRDRDGAASKEADRPDLEVFLQRLGEAHGSADREEPLDRFRAEIRVTPARSDRERIEVDLRATFLAPDRLRYRIAEGGRVLERGRDSEGMWMRDDDQVVALDRGEFARDFAADRRSLAQHVRLARQLLAFLDPAAVARSLEAVQGPAPDTFRLGPKGRGVEIEADAIEGELDGFPLFAPAADQLASRVRLKLWVDRESGRLAAVRAVPIDADGRVAGAPEVFLLREYQSHAGVQLPLSLLIFRGGGPRPVHEASIELRSIDLDQGFDPRRLERTTK